MAYLGLHRPFFLNVHKAGLGEATWSTSELLRHLQQQVPQPLRCSAVSTAQESIRMFMRLRCSASPQRMVLASCFTDGGRGVGCSFPYLGCLATHVVPGDNPTTKRLFSDATHFVMVCLLQQQDWRLPWAGTDFSLFRCPQHAICRFVL